MKKLLLVIFVLLSCFGYSQIYKKYHKSLKLPQTTIYVQPNIIQYDSILIDTIIFQNLLKEQNLYNDFKNKNWSKIDKDKFNYCIEKSKIQLSDKTNEVAFKQNNTIVNDIKSTIQILESVQPKPIEYEQEKLITSELIIEEISSENKATLTYVINDTMMINQTYTIDLTLSRNMSNTQLINIIDGFKNKQLIDTNIIITPIMRARLLDPGNNFKIEPITSEKQNTTDRNLIRWQWQIIPINEGENYLTISVDNYIDGNEQSVNIYNGKTYVYAIHTWYGDLWKIIKNNWTYITYTIGGLLTILGWLYKEKIINIFKNKIGKI